MKLWIALIAVLAPMIAIGCAEASYSGIEDAAGRAEAATNKVKEIPSESSAPPAVLFCPRDNCADNLVHIINNSDRIVCAFFDLNEPDIIMALERKKARVIVDADNYGSSKGRITNLKKDTRSAFMHNKFCVFDRKILWTGSFNPTVNGNTKNDNNVVVISSEYLAQNYEDEFSELWNGEFGKGDPVRYPAVNINGMIIENYFCPEDWCSNKVMRAISLANESIYFMTFSFTHEQIGNLLVKKHEEGVEVKGLFEKRQNSQYSQAAKLNASGIEVMLDSNPAAMHHKVFIIDRKIVVTGSFNPSKNGDTRNDENVLVIHDEKVAKKFLGEFLSLYKI